MADVPLGVSLLLGSVFVALGVGLAYAARDIEPWARKYLWAKCGVWSAFGLSIVVGRWSSGGAAVLITVAVAYRVFLGFRPPTPPNT